MNKIGIGLIDCDLVTSYPTFHSTNAVKDKNKLLDELSVFDYAFLIQKGVNIKDPLIFEHFAITADKTGHQALISGTSEVSNDKILYDKDPYVDYWAYPGTMFMMLTKKAIKEAGEFDENFPANTWDDVEYLHRLCIKGLIPTFGLWIGIKNERFYFDIDQEVLKKRMEVTDKFKKEIDKATKYWQGKGPEEFPYVGKEVKINEKKLEVFK